MEDAIRECVAEEGHALPLFDTSCFSGIYVTGQKIGDDYFAKLHDQRNDQAKQDRLNGGSKKRSLPQQSNDGCESVNNDKRGVSSRDDACESITNDRTVSTTA